MTGPYEFHGRRWFGTVGIQCSFSLPSFSIVGGCAFPSPRAALVVGVSAVEGGIVVRHVEKWHVTGEGAARLSQVFNAAARSGRLRWDEAVVGRQAGTFGRLPDSNPMTSIVQRADQAR